MIIVSMIPILLLAILGFIISLYAYIIETRIKKNSAYKPVCDISDVVSCSKPLRSPYGQLFFVSNSIVGMLLYASIFILVFVAHPLFIVYVALAACLMSIVLAYVLYFKIRALCIVCTAIYAINILLLLVSYLVSYQMYG